MSVESLAIALHHSKASGTARLILVGIANHDGDGGAWPSVGTLAHYAGITPRVVQKHLDTLSDLGEIVKHVQQGGDRTMADYERPNLYEFLLTCPDNCDRTKQHRACKECGEPARKSKKFICTACQLAAVDNSQNPLSPVTPPVTSDTPPLSPVTPPPCHQ